MRAPKGWKATTSQLQREFKLGQTFDRRKPPAMLGIYYLYGAEGVNPLKPYQVVVHSREEASRGYPSMKFFEHKKIAERYARKLMKK